MGKENLSTRDLLAKLDAESDAKEESVETEEPVTEEPELEEVKSAPKEAEIESPPDEDEEIEEVEDAPKSTPSDMAKPVREASEDGGESVLAPFAMSKEDRTWFSKLPKQAQAWIAKREKDRDKGVNQILGQVAGVRKQFEGIGQVLNKHSNRLARYSQQPDQVVDRLLAWDQALQEDPVGTAIQFLQSYNINPRALLQPGLHQQASQQEFRDPRVDQISSQMEQQQKLLIQQQAAAIEQTRAAWASQKDADGMAMFPYAEELAETMAKCVPGLRSEDPQADLNTLLTRAYNRAVDYHPELKEVLTVQREAARKKAQLAAQKTATLAAKKAAVTPRSTTAGGQPYTKKKYQTTRDYLAALDAGDEEVIR